MSLSNLKRLTPWQRELMDRLNEVKIRRPQTEDAFVHLMDYYEMGRAGSGLGFFCLSGETGTGKSTLLKRVKEEIVCNSSGLLPVLDFKLPEKPTRKDFVSSMLAATGDKGAHLGSRTAMEQRLYRRLESLKTEFVICDETNHSVNSDDQLVNFIAADLGKLLVDGFGKGFVFAGTPEFYRMVQSNPQLVGRVGGSFELRPLSLQDEWVEECQEVLLAFDAELPFPEYCFMAGPVQMAIHLAACKSSPGKLVRLTQVAGLSAVRKDRRRIEVDDWCSAWEQMWRGSGGKNPYRELSLPKPKSK